MTRTNPPPPTGYFLMKQAHVTPAMTASMTAWVESLLRDPTFVQFD